MTLDEAINEKFCGMNVVVYENDTILFKGTVGDLSANAILRQNPVTAPIYYDPQKDCYIAKIKKQQQ